MPYKDPEQARLNQARYRERNRAAINERRRNREPEKAEVTRAQNRARYWADPAKYRDQFLQRRYGLSRKQYDAMLTAQGGKCAICGTKEFRGPGKKPHVDHNHVTGRVRGLLCVHCNVLIGMARDSVAYFDTAKAYLRRA